MKFISKFIIFLYFISDIFSIDNIAYTIFQEKSNYPIALINKNRKVVTFSSFNNETYVSIFNSDTTAENEHQHIKLNFEYKYNAAIIEYPDNKYLIATTIDSYIYLIYIDEGYNMKLYNTSYTMSSYKINLLLLNDNSFLLNFISSENNVRKVQIKNFIFPQSNDGDIEFTQKGYTTETDNFFINCIHLKGNHILFKEHIRHLKDSLNEESEWWDEESLKNFDILEV